MEEINANNYESLVMIAIVGGIILVTLLINITLTYFIYLPYSKLPEEVQQAPAGLLWLMILPCINFIIGWIYLPFMIPDSFNKLQAIQNQSDGHTKVESLRTLGIATMIIWTLATGLSFIPFISIFSFIFLIGSLITVIIYMVQLHGLERSLHNSAYMPAPDTQINPQKMSPRPGPDQPQYNPYNSSSNMR